MSALESGVVIGGDYRIVEPLSEGGMGAVYVAEQISTGRRRALKAMKPELVKDARSRRRFVDEARVGARVESAHVVEVMGAGVDDATGIPWLAMELLDGVDLEQLVQRDGPLPLAQVAGLYEQLAHALGRAHERGIIHRDLKPENLFLAASTHYGGEAFLKILDFGIASFVASDKTAATVTSAIGSPLWIAPEQASPGAKLKPSTDVWAMGLIAFYLLTGKNYWLAVNAEPFSLAVLLGEILAHPLVPASERAAALGVTVPDGFDAWFGRCVVRDPEARFDEAHAAVGALQEVAAGTPTKEALREASGVADTVALPPQLLPDASAGQREAAPLVVTAECSRPGSTAVFESTPVDPDDMVDHAATAVSLPTSSTPKVVVGVVAALALLGIAGGFAFGGGDQPEPAPTAGRDPAYAAELAACEASIAETEFAAASAHADLALAARAGDEAATECRTRAGELASQQAATFERGVTLLEAGDVHGAYLQFETLPESSSLRARREIGVAARGYAGEQLAEAREAVERDPQDAHSRAELILGMADITPEQRREAQAIVQAATVRIDAAAARPAQIPRGNDAPRPASARSAPARPASRGSGSSTLMDEARRCSLQGDNRCVIRLLEGHARTPQQLALLIEAYRATNNRERARTHMETFVTRFPNSRQAPMYRQILGRM